MWAGLWGELKNDRIEFRYATDTPRLSSPHLLTQPELQVVAAATMMLCLTLHHLIPPTLIRGYSSRAQVVLTLHKRLLYLMRDPSLLG